MTEKITEIDVPPEKKINVVIIGAEISAALGEQVSTTHTTYPRFAFRVGASRELTKKEIQDFLKNHVYSDPPVPKKPKDRKELYAALTTDKDKITFFENELGLK